jgi:DNA-directed RNA polymerase subunit RPC12/RpoP
VTEPAARLITAVEAAQRGVPQTAVERRCSLCREPFLVELRENDRRRLAGEPVVRCPDCRDRFPEP